MGDYVPRWVKVVRLPPNTTSKLQPLDAGIIQSFKTRYRKRQLQYALDAIDDDLKPYNVNQLQAMTWIRTAWQSVTAECIENCWKHTGILDESLPALPQDPEHIEIQNQIDRLHLQNPMNIHRFLNPAEEDHSHCPILTDEELIEASATVSNDIEQDHIEQEEEMPVPDFNARMNALRWTIRSLEASTGHEATIHALRRHMHDVELEHRAATLQSTRQSQITSFF
jgi:hypothetical protein